MGRKIERVYSKDLPTLDPEEWKILRELFNILKPYEDVTKVISGEKYCTSSLVIPLCNGLKNVLSRLLRNPFSDAAMNVLKALQEGLEKRLGNVQKSNTLTLATFLDPRFKQIVLGSVGDDVKKVINLVAQKISEEFTTTEIQESIEREENDLSIWFDVDKIVSTAQPQGTFRSRSIIEVQRYLEDGNLQRNKDPLQWWCENKHIYPNIAKVAQERLCTLATSVPCERLFSKAGLVLTDRRNRLSDNKVNMILFLNSNYHV